MLICIILFLGGSESRLKKADFLSKTIYYPFVSSINSIEHIRDVKKENYFLRKQVGIMAIKIAEMENYISKIKNIKKTFTDRKNDFIEATVIGFTGSFKERNIIVNKGRLDDIEINSPVITESGIVGKVIMISQNTSTILPFNHSAFKVGILDKKTRVQGVLECDIRGRVIMSMIQTGADVNIGDTLVTSNISSFFPKGFPVGTIEKILQSPENYYMNAYIKPFTDVNNLENVFILKQIKDSNYEQEN